MMEIYETINVLSFIQGYFDWLSHLTAWQLVGLLSFVLVDLLRNIGKPIALSIHNIFRRIRPLPFRNVDNAQTKITILIPAHNEGVSIKNTIESLLDNTYPNKEIIVIDDHSTDNTFEQAYPYYKRGQIKLIKRTEGKGSKSGAINFGIVFATGEVILVMDGDTLLERGALKDVARAMTVPDVVAVAGNVRILSGDDGVVNILTKSQSYEYLIAFELGRRIRLMMGVLVIIPGAFGAFRKSIASKVGLYDKDTITEDFDLGIKIFKTSGKVVFLPNAVGWTYCPNNWKAWMRQRLRWSHGQFTTLKKHKDAVSIGTTYRILFVLGIIDMMFMDVVLLFVRVVSLTYIFLTFQHSILYPLIFMMMIYFVNELIVIITAIVFSSHKSNLRYVYLVPFIIFVYRPVYAFIRFYAYALSLFKREVKW